VRVRFSDVLNIINGKNQKQVENPNGKYPIYGSGGIMGYADSYICEPNTVIIGRKGSINKPIYVEVPFWNVDTAFGLYADKSKLIPKYLYYFCEKFDFEKLSTTVTIPSLTKANLLDIEMQLPPLDEQYRIVGVLDKVCGLIVKRQSQLNMLDELVKSRFIEMFGDPVQNPKGWVKKPFLSMGNCKNGMNFHYEDVGIEIHCLGVGDFKDLTVIDNAEKLPKVSLNKMPSEEYLLKDGDIVFVRSNGNKALVGRSVAVYPSNVPTTFSGFCIRYRKTDDAILAPYLLRVLKADSMRQKMVGRGANIQNLNQQILETLEIPVPSIELQNQFAAFVQQTDKLELAVQKSLEKLEILKKSLMQQYFG